MRAMVLSRPAPIEFEPLAGLELPIPSPGQGELSIAVEACGVCRTDLHTVEGELPLRSLPLVPGHQIVGRVTDIGPGVEPGLVGARVGVAWLAGACGECRYCRSGRENLCPRATFTGLHRDGGYAERALALADFVYPLPAELPAVQAAPLLCAGVIGLRALRLAGAPEGGVLGMFGFGASAHVAIQIARHAGCEVAVFSRAERHRRHALALGASWAGSPEERPPCTLDRAVIFSPAGEQVPHALDLVAPGGVVVCAGVTMSDVPSMPYSLVYSERRLTSVANATRQDARDLLELAAAIPIRTTAEALPLGDANTALGRIKHSQADGALVLVP
ncbi:MAG: zinc-dependent alcohol dehydrogenase family protein [Acidobacteriota bacterium]